MIIGIDGRYIQDHFPGIGRYAYSLTKAVIEAGSGHDLVIYYNPNAKNTRFNINNLTSPKSTLQPMPVDVFSLRNAGIWNAKLTKDKTNVFFSPYYTAPMMLPCPGIVTFHDIIPLKFPQYLPSAHERYAYRFTAFRSARTAARFFTGSFSSKDDLIKYLNLSPSQVTVVPMAADDAFRPYAEADARGKLKEFSLPKRYVLYVGINKPHKNLPFLVRAWKRVVDEVKDEELALVIAGPRDPRYHGDEQESEKLNLGEMVRFLGEIPEEILPYLYSAAEIFVFPSLHEGFGLPVLEAMASGTPVISSNTSSLPEVAGRAAILLPPDDESAWADALVRLLGNQAEREDLSHKGIERASQFSWSAAAVPALQAFEQAARIGKRL